MQPSVKSEASASSVRGWLGLKCCKMGAVVKACWRDQKAASASGDQQNLVVLRVREVRGEARKE